MTPEEEMKRLLETIVAQRVPHRARAFQVRALAEYYGKDSVIDALLEKLAEWQEAYEARFSPPDVRKAAANPLGKYEQE